MDMQQLGPRFETGVHTVVIALLALLYGSVLEKFFRTKPDMWALGQIMLVGVAYDVIRDQYRPDPDAWVVFAACVFHAQPTLLPRLQRLIKLA